MKVILFTKKKGRFIGVIDSKDWEPDDNQLAIQFDDRERGRVYYAAGIPFTNLKHAGFYAWPKSSNWLSNSLRRLGSPLRKIGIDVSHNENDRKVTINKFSTKPENSRNCRIAVANDTAKQQKSEDVENNLTL